MKNEALSHSIRRGTPVTSRAFARTHARQAMYT